MDKFSKQSVRLSQAALNAGEEKLQALRKLESEPTNLTFTRDALEIVCAPYDSEKHEECEFTWKASIINGNELFFKADFKDPLDVS